MKATGGKVPAYTCGAAGGVNIGTGAARTGGGGATVPITTMGVAVLPAGGRDTTVGDSIPTGTAVPTTTVGADGL